jgi:hypothetical protein
MSMGNEHTNEGVVLPQAGSGGDGENLWYAKSAWWGVVHFTFVYEK